MIKMGGWDTGGFEEVVGEAPLVKKAVSLPSFSSFVFKEAAPGDKLVITFYGEKGSGKTMSALGLPGTKSVLCFDNKAQTIKHSFFKDSPDIKVYDATEFFVKDTSHFLESSEITYDYLTFLLQKIGEQKPDWIIIDGLEILTGICEMVMRKHNGLKPYQGVSNLSVWKERRQLLDGIHRRAVQAVKRGVVYTAYCDTQQIIEEGAIVTSKIVPKWVDTVLYETDITVHVENRIGKEGSRIIVKINNSKIPSFLETGKVFDITGKTLGDFIGKM